ncbi:Asp23/Gls24 family envelope stress response protein [Streptomyces subrutilus]|uniref:Asp23/Gls24 family envelope stress response protein n=1 Tax=Streptomyces subrutilus TaxID=36818 RepID=UPI00344A0300
MTTPTPPGPADVSAADRGATRIADRVVAKIAAQAAREALAGGPGNSGAAGRSGGDPTAHATVTVHHDIARVRVSLELDYPSDLAAQCAAVRRQVARRVEEYASMTVPEVAVEIERLHPADGRFTTGSDRRLR